MSRSFRRSLSAAAAREFSSFRILTGGAEVVKIAPDGSPESLWTSRERSGIRHGACHPTGKLLLGTGDKGELIELEGNRCLFKHCEDGVGAGDQSVAGPGGKIFVATANPGKIFTLGPGL